MGRKKKKYKPLIFCYYCDRTFENEKVLIQHQRAKHFKCVVCHKRLGSAHGMMVHVFQVHKQQIDKVPHAKENRDSFMIEVFGMSGVPSEILNEKHIERGEPPLKKARLTPDHPLIVNTDQQILQQHTAQQSMIAQSLMFQNRMNPLLMNPMLFRPNIPQPFIINSNQRQPMPMRMPVPIVHQSPFIRHSMAMHPPSAMIGMHMHPPFVIPPNPTSIPRNIMPMGIQMSMQPTSVMMNNVFNVHPLQMQNTFIANSMVNTLVTNESIENKEINGNKNIEVIAVDENVSGKIKKKKQQILLYDDENISQEEARFACAEYVYHPPVKVVVRNDDEDEDIDVQN